ncbi:hypothetical protein [Chloroflexus sp.]|uniref:hypothetical protein n=1 Tax=Chloroflexus sp. TaxID=1904827 RepID=UPI002ADD8FE9|nr:hypothetical protein [Chloroflexus sp.]
MWAKAFPDDVEALVGLAEVRLARSPARSCGPKALPHDVEAPVGLEAPTPRRQAAQQGFARITAEF